MTILKAADKKALQGQLFSSGSDATKRRLVAAVFDSMNRFGDIAAV